jgi:cytochrome P450
MEEQKRVLAADGKHAGQVSIHTTYTLAACSRMCLLSTFDLRSNDWKVTFESLRDMTFLEACVRETLRIYPPLIILMRMVKEPLAYKDFVLPKGHLLCIAPAVSMSLECSFGKDAATWNPDRWATFPDGQPPKYSYIAFGGGTKYRGEVFSR